MAEQIEVRPGQVWADNDKRSAGRTVRVERIEGGKAVCTILTNRDSAQRQVDSGDPWFTDMRGRQVRITVSRMRPTATGYRLIGDTSEGRSS